jgi:hypothetical protein
MSDGDWCVALFLSCVFPLLKIVHHYFSQHPKCLLLNCGGKSCHKTSPKWEADSRWAGRKIVSLLYGTDRQSPCLKYPTTWPCLEPHQSSPYPHIIDCNITVSPTLGLPNISLQAVRIECLWSLRRRMYAIFYPYYHPLADRPTDVFEEYELWFPHHIVFSILLLFPFSYVQVFYSVLRSQNVLCVSASEWHTKMAAKAETSKRV